MRRLLGGCVAMLTLLGVAGCSTTSNGTPDASGSGGSGVRLAASDPAATPTVSDMKRQLLTVADLPPGWKVDNSDDGSDSNSGEPSCMKSLDALPDPKPEADASFVQGDGFPLLGETVGYVGSSGEHYISLARKAFDGCTNVSMKADGDTIHGTIGRLSFPKLGDDLQAWRMRFTVQGIPFAFDFVVARKGSELLTTVYGDLGSSSVGELTSFTRKALAKMP